MAFLTLGKFLAAISTSSFDFPRLNNMSGVKPTSSKSEVL